MDLTTLLQKAQRLNNDVQLNHELPQVERSLAQVLRETKKLHNRVTSQQGTKDLQAHLLLGSKGVDLPKITNKLVSISARKTFEPVDQTSADVDIQNFLKNERENAILAVIENVNNDLEDMEKQRKWRRMQKDWRAQKIRILDAFVGPSEDFVDIQRLPEAPPCHENPEMASKLTPIEMLFATEVVKYNECVISGERRPELMQRFAYIVGQSNDLRLSEIWSIMLYMSDVTPNLSVDPIQQRQQNLQFITQAKRYLESRYKIYMSSFVDLQSIEMQQDSIVDVTNLVKAFVRASLSQQSSFGLQDLCDELPLWPLVYCALRCGHMKVALEFLKRSDKPSEDLIQMLEAKVKDPEQQINAKLAAQLKFHYTNKVKNSIDAFKKAVYCVLLGCSTHENHAEVTKTTDDFLWIQLSIARANVERVDYVPEQLTYASLQSLIVEKYGESYFGGNEQPHVYFAALALTGQFEAAIEFLVRNREYRAHAVHMAIALNELGLLGGPRSLHQPLLTIDKSDPAPMRRLNFARLLLLYVPEFERVDILEALHYYYLLRSYRNPEGRNMFVACVCEMVIKTGDYTTILGKRDLTADDNTTNGGLFDMFSWGEYSTQDVAKLIADELVRCAKLEPAINVYDISGDHENALKQLCIMLSQLVHVPHKDPALRQRLRNISKDFMQRLNAGKLEIKKHTKETFEIMFQLLIFFDAYHERNYVAAVEALACIKIIPTTPTDIEKCLINFKHLSADICKVLPHTMLAAMEIIYEEFKATKLQGTEQRTGTQEHNEKLDALRLKAKALTSMAASIPYRIPGSVNHSIVELEVKML